MVMAGVMTLSWKSCVMRIIRYNNCDKCDAKNASVDCRESDWRQFDCSTHLRVTSQFELQLKYYTTIGREKNKYYFCPPLSEGRGMTVHLCRAQQTRRCMVSCRGGCCHHTVGGREASRNDGQTIQSEVIPSIIFIAWRVFHVKGVISFGVLLHFILNRHLKSRVKR